MRTETTILMEIEVPVIYTVIPGQIQSWDEPGFDTDIEDLEIDFKEVKRQIEIELDKDENIITMLEDAMQDIQNQQADFLYEQERERRRGVA